MQLPKMVQIGGVALDIPSFSNFSISNLAVKRIDIVRNFGELFKISKEIGLIKNV